jgi:hypothetical protein
MIRLAVVLSALVLFIVPLLTAPMPAEAVAGLMGLLLAAVGIAGFWQWPVTAGRHAGSFHAVVAEGEGRSTG